ncbi:MAG: hypothetical protein P1V51_24705 [Deltaproteobacteria bacterium]|nr:hypothetical protein [Deltaproteobacteria bacterium]
MKRKLAHPGRSALLTGAAVLLLVAACGAEGGAGVGEDGGGETDGGPDGGAPDAGGDDGGTPPRCGDFPASCAGVEPTAITEHRMVALEACAFGLVRSGDPAAARAIFDEIAPLAGGYRPLSELLQNLNRAALSGVTADTADRLQNHPYLGFRWNAGDMATTDWYPQGITGGSDRQADGRPEGRRLILVSWYDHTGNTPAKGVRVSLVDLTDPADVTYRHLLLVEPRREGGAATFGPVVTGSGGALHAGGMVWIGDLLLVADTGNGFRVFDLSLTLQTTHTDDKTRIGVSAGRVDGHGYRYVVPQVARYVMPAEACDVRFSFAGLDRSASPPVIVSGEYHSGDVLGRLVSWPVDLATGWLQEEADGVVRGQAAVVGAQTRMQGGLSWAGNYYLSCSSQTASGYGRLYRTRPGLTSSISAWPYGAEDLYYERDVNRIWTAAEHPDARDTVSILRLDP